jgi:hypothetical protein
MRQFVKRWIACGLLLEDGNNAAKYIATDRQMATS